MKNQESNNHKLPKSLLTFYLRYGARGHWPLLIAWMISMLVATSGAVWYPLTEGWFVSLFERPALGSVSEFIITALPTIVLILLLNLMTSAASTLRGMWHARWSAIIKNQVSETLVDVVHSQSMGFWTGRMAGKVNAQITYIVDGFYLLQPLFRSLAMVLMMLLNIGLIFAVNGYVAVIISVIFVTRLVYSLIMFKPVNRASKDRSEAASHLSGHVIDSLSNYSIVKIFAAARDEKRYLVAPREKQIKTLIYSHYMQRFMWALPMFVWDICHAGVMFLCVWLFAGGKILVSEIVFTMAAYYSLMGNIAQIVDMLPEIIDKYGAARKSYDELNVESAVIDAENASDLVVTHGKIEFRHVWFKYKRKWVLRDVNLTIKPGERVGFVGVSGAGKTTLVHLLLRMYEPTRGQILIDGVDIRDVTQDSLRRAIGFIPQEPTMFNRSLRDNIAYGNPGATMREIRRASRRAAADEFIMATDKKYDSMVGDRGIKLSGGQRQRVAIARAFLKNAPILVLDEATSALDSETEVAIQQSFEDLASDRTTIAIAHRLSTLRNMDKIVVLNSGQISEQGTHRSLLRAGGEYARLWAMQSDGFIQE